MGSKKALLFNICKENKKGFSVKYSNLKPLNSDKNLYCIAITDISHKNLNFAVNKVLKLVNGFNQIKNKLVIGGWFDGENKRYCLDLVITETNKIKALYLANMFNQMAIFNLKDYSEILNLKYCKGVKKA